MMTLTEMLIGRGLVSRANIFAAEERQRRSGGELSDILVDLDLVTPDQMAEVLKSLATPKVPPMPRDIEDTGIAMPQLLQIMLKLMQVEALETVYDLSLAMRLPFAVVRRLMDEAQGRKLVEALGSTGASLADIRYALSQNGRDAARAALEQCLYAGPAPVSLAAYQAQVLRQTIRNEHLRADDMRDGFRNLIMPERYVRKLLPAINAGRSILLFGPPGNGKTTFAFRIAELYSDTVYIPYAVEIAGQIMRVFDPGLHRPMPDMEAGKPRQGVSARDVDLRWVPCYRPFAVAGGELTLDMLDLQFDPNTKDYTAPLHVKALNGVFLIDDFGRQQMDPKDLLNRWIVPMESRIDFLKLRSGKTFSLPFDDLLIFSTNMDPTELMDPALLRRIPYKMKLYAPTREEFVSLFDMEARKAGLSVAPGVIDFVIRALNGGPEAFGIAYFQPKFICDQVTEVTRAFGLEKRITKELAVEALSNLYVQIEGVRDNPVPQA